MKFLISRNELNSCIGSIQNIVAPKTPMPILSNFLVEAHEDSTVTITVTDLIIAVRYKGPAKVLEPGSTTIPARRFAQIVRELAVPYVEISSNENDMIRIVADSASFRLPGIAKDDYPLLPDFQGAKQITLKQRELKEALFRTSFAVSRDETRYALTGVSFEVFEKVAYFVGSDGKRLARAAIPLNLEDELTYECIIPSKAVDEVIKNLSDGDEDATVYLQNDKIAVNTADRLVITKLLSGEYPDVDRVIPRQCSYIVSINKEELSLLLRQISPFVTENMPSVRFTLHDGQLLLAANTADVGEGKVSMSVQYTGPRFDIAFSPIMFLDILKHCREEYFYMGFQDAYNPVIISDSEFSVNLHTFPNPLFVLMPMRLNNE